MRLHFASSRKASESQVCHNEVTFSQYYVVMYCVLIIDTKEMPCETSVHVIYLSNAYNKI